MGYEWIGWVATAVVASSYLFKQSAVLKRIQAGGAVLWLIYGLTIHALPIIAANLIVAAAAGVSSFIERRGTEQNHGPSAAPRRAA